MIFTVIKTSSNIDRDEIEINTLNELIEWINKQKHECIVSDGLIEIYDDYRE